MAATRARGHSPAPSFQQELPAGILLDLRAESRDASLQLLLAAAASTMAEVLESAVDCAVTFPRRRGPLALGTSDSALGLARAGQDPADSPVCQALAGRVAVIANNYTPHPDWPEYWLILDRAGYRSILSVPMPLPSGTYAALTFLSGADNVFTASVTAAAAAFTKRAGRSYALAEDIRTARAAAEQLSAALDTRAPIAAACGVIMEQNQCSYDDAFQILAKASSHRNIKLRVVAQTILENLPGSSWATPS